MIDALKEFHEMTKKIHCDIKNENFRVHHGKVYLIDFGIVKDYIDQNTGTHVAMQVDQ